MGKSGRIAEWVKKLGRSNEGLAGMLRIRVRASFVLWLVMTLASLVLLNHLTAGTGRNCKWSLFGIWAERYSYIIDSGDPMYYVGQIFVGAHGHWLLLYTSLHIVVAIILGWAAAAVICSIRALWRYRLREGAGITDRRKG